MNKPNLYTLTSIIIGYFLTNNKNALEQNALGNYFMTIGQIIEANAAYIQLEQANNNNNYINTNLSFKDKQEILNFFNEIENIIEQIKKEL